MRASIISLGLATIIGVVIGLLLQSPDKSPSVEQIDNDLSQAEIETSLPPAENANNEINVLRQQLLQEITARKNLQNSVEKLSQKLAKLETQKQHTSETAKAASTNMLSQGNAENRDWFNEQALVDAGVDPEVAKNLKSRYESQELEKLYLRDKAMREGWFGGRQYRDELEKLDGQLSGLQKELGDEPYSAYLFATGQSNRVTVQSVLAKSSADTAGILASDQITRYGSQRIYNWRDLRDATTRGDLSETVTVEIIREGKPMQVYVQRGPLGIRMSSVSLAP